MTLEPKCVLWKRLGAEQVQKQIEGFTLEEELAFWRKQTEELKAMQQEAQRQSSSGSKTYVMSPAGEEVLRVKIR